MGVKALRFVMACLVLVALSAPVAVSGSVAPDGRKLVTPLLFSEGTTAITETGAKISANVITDDEVLGYAFEYGTTEAYGSKTDAVVDYESGRARHITTDLTGLLPGTRYFWRAVAAPPAGTTFGEGRSFTTDGEAPGAQG